MNNEELRLANDEDRRMDVEWAAYMMLLKFHKETDCGDEGMHWHECDQLVTALGFSSWEVWHTVVSDLGPLDGRR